MAIPGLPTTASHVGVGSRARPVRQGLRTAPIEEVVASTMASMAGTSLASVVRATATSLVARATTTGLQMALVTPLEGLLVQVATTPSTVASIGGGAIAVPSRLRTILADARAVALRRETQIPKVDAGVLPPPTSSVGQGIGDGRRQEVGMRTALATVARRAPSPLALRPTVAPLVPLRGERPTYTASRREAVGTPTYVAATSSLVTLGAD